jgi:pimeloyl-ACP methyl ester carboxylesterase
VAAGYELLFSEGLPRERLARYASLLTPESPRALFDAHMPGPVIPAAHCQVPTLVVGGDLDRLVWYPSTVRTALYHGAEHLTAWGMGHFLQIDLGAEELAERLADWLEGRGLAGVGSTLV